MNLELANTFELAEELAKRFETCIIMGLKAPLTSTGKDASPMKYRGGALEAIGMCHMATMFIASDIGLSGLTKDDI